MLTLTNLKQSLSFGELEFISAPGTSLVDPMDAIMDAAFSSIMEHFGSAATV